MRYVILLILINLVCASSLSAAPSISGVGLFAGGSTVSISGSDFTSHSDYSASNSNTIARAWNNFESGAVIRDDWSYGLSGAYSGNWSVGSGGSNRGGSSYYGDRIYSSSTGSRLGGLLVGQNGDQNEWYFTFYIQISDTCPTSGGQGKIARIYGDNGNQYWAPYGSSNTIFSFFESINGSQWGSPDGLGTNEWHRVEMYMSQSPQESTLWIDGVHQWTRNDWPASDFNGGGHSWEIGNMVEGVQNTCHHRFDDVFFNHTESRVELCTGQSWASKGTCEVQVPTSWSTTSIAITANTGPLATDDTAYLYVVDSAGDANSLGYEITVGSSGGSDTTPPVLSLPTPSGNLSYGTTSTTEGFVTDEAAICKASDSPGVAYASMIEEFGTALAMSHSRTVSGLTNGSSYTRYVRCIDGSGNANTSDFQISYSVASAPSSSGEISFEYSSYSGEQGARIPINIIRTGGNSGAATVDISTNGQTATHGTDYYGTDGETLTFTDGCTLPCSVAWNTYGSGDDGLETIDTGATQDRYLEAILSNVTGGATLGSPSLVNVTVEGVEVVNRLTAIQAGFTRIMSGVTPVFAQ